MSKLESIAIDVAVIKSNQQGTNDHLKTLNGKVATQEGRQQASDNSVALITQTVSTQQKQIDNLLNQQAGEQKEKLTFWERNADKLFYFALACAWAYYMSKK